MAKVFPSGEAMGLAVNKLYQKKPKAVCERRPIPRNSVRDQGFLFSSGSVGTESS